MRDTPRGLFSRSEWTNSHFVHSVTPEEAGHSEKIRNSIIIHL